MSRLKADPAITLETEVERLPAQLVLEATELDQRLYQRAGARLDQHINTIPYFERRLLAFQARCLELRQKPSRVKVKPPKTWTRLPSKLN